MFKVAIMNAIPAIRLALGSLFLLMISACGSADDSTTATTTTTKAVSTEGTTDGPSASTSVDAADASQANTDGSTARSTERVDNTVTTRSSSTETANSSVQANDAPLSEDSLRGDVLAKALQTSTNQAGTDAHGRQQEHPTSAVLWNASWPNGKRQDNRWSIPDMVVDQRIIPEESSAGSSWAIYRIRAYPARPVSYGLKYETVELQLHTSAQGLPDDIRSTAADTELLRLDRHLQLTVFPATANQETESAVTQSMLSPADFSIRRNARLRWNEPLHTWTLAQTPDQGRPSVQLSLVRGKASRDFAICLTARLFRPDLRRTCTLWQIPTDWTPAAPLVYQGQHVVNRIRIHARTENSRQPGHGYLIDHWQSKTTGQ